jgi:hypothetical protein
MSGRSDGESVGGMSGIDWRPFRGLSTLGWSFGISQ